MCSDSVVFFCSSYAPMREVLVPNPNGPVPTGTAKNQSVGKIWFAGILSDGWAHSSRCQLGRWVHYRLYASSEKVVNPYTFAQSFCFVFLTSFVPLLSLLASFSSTFLHLRVFPASLSHLVAPTLRPRLESPRQLISRRWTIGDEFRNHPINQSINKSNRINRLLSSLCCPPGTGTLFE